MTACTTSGAEELQKKARGAKVVKAFNTNFAQHMETGRVGDEALTVLAVVGHGTATGFHYIH